MSIPRPVGSSIPIASVPNLRDAGGYRTADGSLVRTGRIYRSTDLAAVADADLPALEALQLATVFDLRTLAEREVKPDRIPAGAKEVPLDVLADRDASQAPAMMQKILDDPVLAEDLLGGDQAGGYLIGSYRDFVSMPSAVAAYRALYTDLARRDDTAVLIHCTTGKDRTGWAVAALLLLLGVDEGRVFDEYLLTNDQLLPALAPVFDRFRDAGGNPDILLPLLGVRRDYLEAALDEMRTGFGDIEGYFVRGLGLGADDIAALRGRLLTRD
ncbi:tyrosine-protein phosphatase [Rhodococcus sp. NPDC058505]|uniref:tyrosine-protein phosphatase n=1 Tax=unclassified Rhodococcus (in: high G+C Gram-positive bacteria) TaxID=192944 RepID=UPI00365F5D99